MFDQVPGRQNHLRVYVALCLGLAAQFAAIPDARAGRASAIASVFQVVNAGTSIRSRFSKLTLSLAKIPADPTLAGILEQQAFEFGFFVTGAPYRAFQLILPAPESVRLHGAAPAQYQIPLLFSASAMDQDSPMHSEAGTVFIQVDAETMLTPTSVEPGFYRGSFLVVAVY